jgi:hypothetical protein
MNDSREPQWHVNNAWPILDPNLCPNRREAQDVKSADTPLRRGTEQIYAVEQVETVIVDDYGER